jgi:predicted GNAT family N-acyltransferase
MSEPSAGSVEIVSVDDPGNLAEALAIRTVVFVDGQGVPPAIERDGLDDVAAHLLARVAGRPVGTLRWRLVEPRLAKIERVAVLAPWRGAGIGRALLDRALQELIARGVVAAKLHAQADATRFYEPFGFRPSGQPFLEAGIRHQAMVVTLAAHGHRRT